MKRFVVWSAAAITIVTIYIVSNVFLLIDANATLQRDMLSLQNNAAIEMKRINESIRIQMDENVKLQKTIQDLQKVRDIPEPITMSIKNKKETQRDTKQEEIRQETKEEEKEEETKQKTKEERENSLMCVSPYGISPLPLLPYFYNDDIKTIFKEVKIIENKEMIVGVSNGGSWGDLGNNSMTPTLLLHNDYQQLEFLNYNTSFFNQDITLPGTATASCWGDYNLDGWEDVLILGNGPDTLYYNNKTKLAKGHVFDYDTYGQGIFCQFMDLNKDGRLDIVRVNKTHHLSLFLNVRNKGFVDITNTTILPPVVNFVVGLGFFGREPVFVLNSVDNRLEFYDMRKLPFENISWKFSEIPRYTKLVDVKIFDMNHDKLLDLVLLSSSLPPVIWFNRGQYSFTPYVLPPLSEVYGYSDALNVQLAVADFDNDALPDIFVVRKTLYANAPNILYMNQESSFLPLFNGGGAAGSSLGRGNSISLADYNFDGAMDIALFNGGGEGPFNAGPTQLFANTPNDNNWIEIELIGTGDAINGYGTLVGVKANDVIQIQVLSPSRNHRRLHFGLGNATVVQKILIFWPVHHATQTYYGLAPNQLVTLVDFIAPIPTGHVMDIIRTRGTNKLMCDPGFDRIKPNFFILGIWKAGTTSLAATLDYHPQVLIGASKEYYYFTRYFDKLPIDWYWSLFPCGDPAYHVSYDATAGYLFDYKAPALLQPHHPNAKFIIMLRDPIARAYSHFYMSSGTSNEEGPEKFDILMQTQVQKFKECAAIEGEINCSTRSGWLYLNAGLYCFSIQRWFDYFPPENFIFNQFNDLVGKDGKDMVKRIQAFLGLEVFEMETRTKNKSPKRPPMYNSTYSLLKNFYKPYNQKLYSLLNIDFGWDKDD